MLTLRDIYIHEALTRKGDGRHKRGRAPGDEGPRRPLIRRATNAAGRALIGLGVQLLTLGGELPRTYLVRYTAPPTYPKN